MGSNPSYFTDEENLPVDRVSWNEAKRFVEKLSKLTGMKFRLPTEKEWEYAARGGMMSKGHKYSGSDVLSEVAWYEDNSEGRTHPVKSLKPNELGIYDMSGNVFEWCEDNSGDYRTLIPTILISKSTQRIMRGGSWGDNSNLCRVSCRCDDAPEHGRFINGLRLAMSKK